MDEQRGKVPFPRFLNIHSVSASPGGTLPPAPLKKALSLLLVLAYAFVSAGVVSGPSASSI